MIGIYTYTWDNCILNGYLMSECNPQITYFFCGIGGSGMSSLAAIFVQKGYCILGSDRSYDQGTSKEKFQKLLDMGIKLFPQDGSGITNDLDALIVSSAVEDSIPDVKAAIELNIPIRKRAELLVEIFNESKIGISVAGTSGKSTVTGMIATVLSYAGFDPTVMNGGIINNFESNMRVGMGEVFVTETDESDGLIALYNPDIAVLNNIALDHKSLEELEILFSNFIAKASNAVVLNFDDEKIKALADKAGAMIFSYAIEDQSALLKACNITLEPSSTSFDIYELDTRKTYQVNLRQSGEHNIYNALACLSVCKSVGLQLDIAIKGLEEFTGIKRRFEFIGTKNGITVIDDFAHNPDKISATLKTLKLFDGNLIVIFQPHGFSPLKLMGHEIAESFVKHLSDQDILLMTEPFYAGGTTDRSISSKDIVDIIVSKNCNAICFKERMDILPFIKSNAKSGDRIVIMGARDDSLSDFAQEILDVL